jgi:hypothetical protein
LNNVVNPAYLFWFSPAMPKRAASDGGVPESAKSLRSVNAAWEAEQSSDPLASIDPNTTYSIKQSPCLHPE